MIREFVFVLVAAYIWAKLEIEIEGTGGWAANLPTWRIKHPLLNIALGDRPLTGYHLWAFSFIIAVFHMPFVWSWTWNARLEFRAISWIFVFWVVEDLVWFLANPAFGWKNHNPHKATWHTKWLWGLPADHWRMLLCAAILFIFSLR
jgi:hypothetical protein